MQIRATMFSTECPTTSCSIKKHASCRRVSEMKNLLPLRLLSPPLPDLDLWTTPGRFTFGESKVELEVDQTQTEVEAAHSNLARRPPNTRARLYRDIPIYTKAGPPLLGDAYVPQEEFCFSYSPVGSSYDDCGIRQELEKPLSPMTRYQPRESLFYHADKNGIRCLPQISRARRRSVDQSSELSFQCTGELFYNESTWMKSPLCSRPKSRSLPLNWTQDMPEDLDTESWLSDTSSCDGEEEIVACATALAPAKAQVIEVNRLSGLSITIPPRSSSLGATVPALTTSENFRDSWMSFVDSPPSTPAEFWREPGTSPSREPSFKRIFHPLLPRRRLDLAMRSPPLSPVEDMQVTGLKSSPARLTVSTDMCFNPELETAPISIENSTLSDFESIDKMISTLERLTSNFPSTMLLPETPCISILLSTILPSATKEKPPRQTLPPPFSQEPTIRRRKTTTFIPPASSHQRIPSETPKSCPLCNDAHDSRSPHLPDLEPLRKIFPESSKFMRSALYTHFLVYSYVSSIPPPIPPTEKRGRRRRDTPYWTLRSMDVSLKAASVLGMEVNYVDFDVVFARRIRDLADKLRKCIVSLIRAMEGDGREESVILVDRDTDMSDMVLIRALEEVVKGCERECFGSLP